MFTAIRVACYALVIFLARYEIRDQVFFYLTGFIGIFAILAEILFNWLKKNRDSREGIRQVD